MNFWEMPTIMMDLAFVLILFVTVTHIGNLLLEMWNDRVYEKDRLKRRSFLKRREEYYHE